MLTTLRSKVRLRFTRLPVAFLCQSFKHTEGQVAWPSDNPVLIERVEHDADRVVTSTVLGSNRMAYKYDAELEHKDPYYSTLSEPDYFETAKLFTMREMVEARVHMGHKIGTLTPEMKPFLYGERLGMCVFDLDKTAAKLRVALNVIAHVAYRGGVILFVTQDRWHIHSVEKAAKECGEYSHCHLVPVGLFTNAGHLFGHTVRLPDLALFLSTLQSQLREHSLVIEAAKMQVLSVGIVDSNCNPNLISYPIPGNDDSMVSLHFYLKVFKEAIRLGKEKRREHFGVDAAQ